MPGVRGEGAWDGLHHLSLWHPQVTSGGRLRPFVAAPHKPAAAPAALAAQLPRTPRSLPPRSSPAAPAALAAHLPRAPRPLPPRSPRSSAAAPVAVAAELPPRSPPSLFMSYFVSLTQSIFFVFRPPPKSLPTAPSLHVTPAGLEPRVLEPTTNITLRSALRPSQKVAARRLISLRRERFRVYLKFPPV